MVEPKKINLTHKVQQNGTFPTVESAELFVALKEKRAMLEEIMQADHDALQLEQYLLENSRRIDTHIS